MLQVEDRANPRRSRSQCARGRITPVCSARSARILEGDHELISGWGRSGQGRQTYQSDINFEVLRRMRLVRAAPSMMADTDRRCAADMMEQCNFCCRCDAASCHNRVVQRGLRKQLEVFWTHDARGWGVRCSEDLQVAVA